MISHAADLRSRLNSPVAAEKNKESVREGSPYDRESPACGTILPGPSRSGERRPRLKLRQYLRRATRRSPPLRVALFYVVTVALFVLVLMNHVDCAIRLLSWRGTPSVAEPLPPLHPAEVLTTLRGVPPTGAAAALYASAALSSVWRCVPVAGAIRESHSHFPPFVAPHFSHWSYVIICCRWPHCATTVGHGQRRLLRLCGWFR